MTGESKAREDAKRQAEDVARRRMQEKMQEEVRRRLGAHVHSVGWGCALSFFVVAPWLLQLCFESLGLNRCDLCHVQMPFRV